MCVKLVTYNDYSEMHVQQNIKFVLLCIDLLMMTVMRSKTVGVAIADKSLFIIDLQCAGLTL